MSTIQNAGTLMAYLRTVPQGVQVHVDDGSREMDIRECMVRRTDDAVVIVMPRKPKPGPKPKKSEDAEGEAAD